MAIKAAESSPATTALMSELAEKYLDKDLVRFINGAATETTRVTQSERPVTSLAKYAFFLGFGITMGPQ